MNFNNDKQDSVTDVALYAVGALTAEERAAFEAALDRPEATAGAIAAELLGLDPVIAALSDALPPLAPRPAVRDQLMARVAAQTQAKPDESERPPISTPASVNSRRRPRNWFLQRDSEHLWKETGFPGVRIRMLFLDRKRDEYTALVRMAAGSSYPSHVHNGPEECVVLEGDVRSGGYVLHAWDYQRAEPNTYHGVLTTDQGCLLLLRAAVTNEVI